MWSMLPRPALDVTAEAALLRIDCSEVVIALPGPCSTELQAYREIKIGIRHAQGAQYPPIIWDIYLRLYGAVLLWFKTYALIKGLLGRCWALWTPSAWT